MGGWVWLPSMHHRLHDWGGSASRGRGSVFRGGGLHPGEGGLHQGEEGLHPGGGGLHPGEGVCIRGRGVCIQGDWICIQVGWADLPRTGKSRQYSYYWNAFLLFFNFSYVQKNQLCSLIQSSLFSQNLKIAEILYGFP